MTISTDVAISTVQARTLTDKIKVAVEGTWHLITEAYTSRAWSALGYSSWDDYCTREFGTSRLRLPREERAETVQSLRDSGLSLRAISSATGNDVKTIRGDLAQVREIPTPAPRVAEPAAAVDTSTGEVLEDNEETEVNDGYRAQPAPVRGWVVPPSPVIGQDGKTYPSSPTNKPTKRRKPITDVAADLGADIRKNIDALLRLVGDDRLAANEEQVALALRGHLLYAAETVAAVLDQLP